MATSTIKGKSISFTATRASSATDGTFLGTYDIENGIVTIAYSIRFGADSPTGTALYTIPSECRPTSAVEYPVLVYTSTNQPVAFRGFVNPSGTITQTATSSCRQAVGVATYKI